MSDTPKVEMVEVLGLDGLRSVGPGVMWPTQYRPHLLCARRGKNESLLAVHGVHFSDRKGDLIATANNGIGTVEVRLRGQGHLVPKPGVTVPAAAMKILANAEGEQATIWFHAPKVSILVDGSLHQFDAIPPDLPFPKPRLHRGSTWRSGATVLDARQLRKIADALSAEALDIRDGDKTAVHVAVPADEDACGWLALRTGGSEDDA